jgi:hypothetical protein
MPCCLLFLRHEAITRREIVGLGVSYLACIIFDMFAFGPWAPLQALGFAAFFSILNTAFGGLIMEKLVYPW